VCELSLPHSNNAKYYIKLGSVLRRHTGRKSGTVGGEEAKEKDDDCER